MFSITCLSRHPAGPTIGSYTGDEKTMAAISPAFGRAYRASAINSRHGAGHDREPRRGGPSNSPGCKPRDTDPHQHLLSPARAAQPTLLRRPLTHRHSTHRHPAHRGPIPVIDTGRHRGRSPMWRRSVQLPVERRQILPNPARSCQIRTPITWRITVGHEREPVPNETNPIPPEARDAAEAPAPRCRGTARRARLPVSPRHSLQEKQSEPNPAELAWDQCLPSRSQRTTQRSRPGERDEPNCGRRPASPWRSSRESHAKQNEPNPAEARYAAEAPVPRYRGTARRARRPVSPRHSLHEKRNEPNPAEAPWNHTRARDSGPPRCILKGPASEGEF